MWGVPQAHERGGIPPTIALRATPRFPSASGRDRRFRVIEPQVEPGPVVEGVQDGPQVQLGLRRPPAAGGSGSAGSAAGHVEDEELGPGTRRFAADEDPVVGVRPVAIHGHRLARAKQVDLDLDEAGLRLQHRPSLPHVLLPTPGVDLVGRGEDLDRRDERPCLDVADLQEPLLQLVEDRHLDVDHADRGGLLLAGRLAVADTIRSSDDRDIRPAHEVGRPRAQQIDALLDTDEIPRGEAGCQIIGNRRD